MAILAQAIIGPSVGLISSSREESSNVAKTFRRALVENRRAGTVTRGRTRAESEGSDGYGRSTERALLIIDETGRRGRARGRKRKGELEARVKGVIRLAGVVHSRDP